MSKFKDGDRVAVYESSYRFIATVHAICDDYIVVIKDYNSESLPVHEKQCRKLKPKAKKEHRTVFINKFSVDLLSQAKDDNTVSACISKTNITNTDVEFIEVIKKDNK